MQPQLHKTPSTVIFDGVMNMAEEITLDAIMAEIFSELPEVKQKWEATQAKREIAKKLIAMRMAAGLTQEQIAKFTGWGLSTVESVEGPFGDVPSVEVVGGYVQACGRNISGERKSETDSPNDAQKLIEQMKQHAKSKRSEKPQAKTPPLKYSD